jgi:hypothetical protein
MPETLALLARQLPHAFVTLWQVEALRETVPANLAFLAMTHHQLGQKQLAQAALARLRIIASRPECAKDQEVQTFLSQAEMLLASERAGRP